MSAAESAVKRAGDAVTDMAYFGLRGASPADDCERMVRGSAVYVGIIGFQYGSRVQDRDDQSYTELEYETATRIGLPRLVFLLDPDAVIPLPPKAIIDREHGSRQDAFRSRLRDAAGLTTAFVASPEELQTKLFQALTELARSGDPRLGPLFNAPLPLHKVVSRPDLMKRVVDVLDSPPNGDRRAGRTTVLRGAGGFGKTTLAAQVCQEVRDRFPGGILWVTVGQGVEGAELAGKVNDVALQISAQRPTFVDPEQAGLHLGRVLGNERRLLVVDDVWTANQLRPFLSGGQNCARLVTTRIDPVMPADAVRVEVDAMTAGEALSLLADGLGDQVPDLTDLLRRTGRWPVLLRVVNGAIRRYVDLGATIEEAVSRVEASLAAGGPAALGGAAQTNAVSATVEASLQALFATGQDHLERYFELAAFSGDVDIFQSTLEAYWGHTGGLSPAEVERLCFLLADLSLVQEYRLIPRPRLRMHDVLVDYLRQRVGADRRGQLHRSLLDAHRRLLPTAEGRGAPATAWWEMSAAEPYLWSHLAHHLSEAGEVGELRSLVTDLRWVVAKLERQGPVAVDADLVLAGGQVADALRLRLAQDAHLLDVLDPSHGMGATLLARLEGQPGLEAVVSTYAASFEHPRLTPAWPLPDLPHPAAIRTFRGQGGPVVGLAVGPEGIWLGTAREDRTIQIWGIQDGTLGVEVVGHPHAATALAASPDGRWVATAGEEGTVQLWSVDHGSRLVTLAGHQGPVLALAISPDGTWLAAAGSDGTVRMWRVPESSEAFSPFTAHDGPVRALAAGPDSSWLASAGDDRAIRLWNVPEGTLRRTLEGHAGAVLAVCVSPDESWLASAGDDQTIRIWGMKDGVCRAVIPDQPGPVRALAASPDGSWLASAGDHRDVRLWNAADGSPRATLTGHTRHLRALAASPDGAWLASAGFDQTVRLWITVTSATHATLSGHTGPVRAVGVAPDGAWLASAGDDHTVRLWNAADGSSRATLIGHTNSVGALAVAHDGCWLASAGRDQTVRIWDVASGSPRQVLTGHSDGVRALALSPDDTWLASGGHDKVVRLWDVASGTQLGDPIESGFTVTALAISPDGTWLAIAGHDRSVQLWDVASRSPRLTLSGHDFSAVHVGRSFSVTALAIGPAGTWMASAGHDRTVRLWSTVDGSLRAVLTGHSDTVRGLAVSPDGAWLASAATDQTVRVWSTATCECVTVLRVDGALRACQWLPSPPLRLIVAGDAGVYLLEYLLPG